MAEEDVNVPINIEPEVSKDAVVISKERNMIHFFRDEKTFQYIILPSEKSPVIYYEYNENGFKGQLALSRDPNLGVNLISSSIGYDPKPGHQFYLNFAKGQPAPQTYSFAGNNTPIVSSRPDIATNWEDPLLLKADADNKVTTFYNPDTGNPAIFIKLIPQQYSLAIEASTDPDFHPDNSLKIDTSAIPNAKEVNSVLDFASEVIANGTQDKQQLRDLSDDLQKAFSVYFPMT